ncbi:MAG: tRNA uridine-5-carboxymethylaminomethyl(34) synthesis enzyme MnmG, partial [candidate division Zixibacteria bacterium]|nr:tRNA uridine-5-carboxymethylaminomethyl(34) synthesis enzyme MnmG [candidate division Zixibacteria bacterium]
WSTRIQSDRIAYSQFVVDYLAQQKNVSVLEGIAAEILTENGRACGVRTESGELVTAHAVILATGTFLGGLIHIGEKTIKSGRMGEPGAYRLSESLVSLGFELGQLKTGTPPRLDGNTIDFAKCELQPGHEPPPHFSYRSTEREMNQVPCHLTKTSAETKRIVSDNFQQSPIFSGKISSVGPRYCPSIEDKFYRFAKRESHQIFLEPEGNGTSEIYPNGFATALPEDVQYQAIRTVVGLQEVRLTQPGYAIEYDYVPAHQIKPSMETRRLPGLFLAGQINGTSGYEEAAGQGLMAGVNAVLAIEGEQPFVLDRSEAYVGVMIDDLVTRSTTEPYRLFTSRAEYRLALREDNARDRLNQYARKYNLIPAEESDAFEDIRSDTDRVIAALRKKRVKVSDLGELSQRYQRAEMVTLDNMIRQPNISINEAVQLVSKFDPTIADNMEVLERAAIAIRYRGYIEKQQREIDKFKRQEAELIPADFDFSSITGLKREALDKFVHFQPGSLGQAGRIEGVTPGDIAVLSVFLKRHNESR